MRRNGLLRGSEVDKKGAIFTSMLQEMDMVTINIYSTSKRSCNGEHVIGDGTFCHVCAARRCGALVNSPFLTAQLQWTVSGLSLTCVTITPPV